MNRMDWLVRNLMQENTGVAVNTPKDYEKELIKTVDEVLTKPYQAIIFTKTDYHNILDAAIKLIPTMSKDEASGIIHLVSIVEYGATLPKTKPFPREAEIISGFKAYAAKRGEGNSKSSEFLKSILDQKLSITSYSKVKQTLSEIMVPNTDLDTVMKACRELSRFEESIMGREDEEWLNC